MNIHRHDKRSKRLHPSIPWALVALCGAGVLLGVPAWAAAHKPVVQARQATGEELRAMVTRALGASDVRPDSLEDAVSAGQVFRRPSIETPAPEHRAVTIRPQNQVSSATSPTIASSTGPNRVVKPTTPDPEPGRIISTKTRHR